MYVCMYVYMYICVYVYMFVHLYIYTYVFLHIYICRVEHCYKNMYSIHIWVLEGVLQCMLSADAVLESLGLLTTRSCEICTTTFEVIKF